MDDAVSQQEVATALPGKPEVAFFSSFPTCLSFFLSFVKVTWKCCQMNLWITYFIPAPPHKSHHHFCVEDPCFIHETPLPRPPQASVIFPLNLS